MPTMRLLLAFALLLFPAAADVHIKAVHFVTLSSYGGRTYWAQTNLHTNAEILFEQWSVSNLRWEIWSMDTSGGHQVNMSLLSNWASSLPGKSCGEPSYSPDGVWVLMGCQAATSTLPSFTTGSQSYGGDNTAWVCRVDNSTGCTKIYDQTIDGQHGVFTPKFSKADNGARIFLVTNDCIGPSCLAVGATNHIRFGNFASYHNCLRKVGFTFS